jgi:hypothetical protein
MNLQKAEHLILVNGGSSFAEHSSTEHSASALYQMQKLRNRTEISMSYTYTTMLTPIAAKQTNHIIFLAII